MGNGREQWTSRWGLILSALGMAIGTGNIWRFPRVAAANGGGSFMIAWIVALLLWSIPVLMMEGLLGRETRMGCIGAFKKWMGEKYAWLGALLAWISLAIAFYYAVVMGWCLRYFVYAIEGKIGGAEMNVKAAEAMWKAFTSNPSQTILFHFLAMLIATIIIYRGISKGTELANKIIIPMLFIVLAILAVRALTLPGAGEGVKYLFSPNLKRLLTAKTWLEGFSQSAWSTGAGWGLFLTYMVYTSKKEDVVLNSFMTGFGNNSASILAGFAVIGTVFALSPSIEAAHKAVGSGNTGLAFIYLTALFSKMPAGVVFAALFFLALTIAALSSELSMLELGIRLFRDAGWSRKKAALWVGIICFILGLPSSANITILNNQDWVWGVGLMISGLLCAIAIFKSGVAKAREIMNKNSDMKVGVWWDILVYLIPVWFVLLIGWWIYQSITWYPKDWWNPNPFTHTYSVGTILVQWAIASIVIYLLNDFFAKTARYEHTEIGDTYEK